MTDTAEISRSNPPLLIALTGGIASGKSAVADLFAKEGVPVLDTDRIARDVVEPGTAALTEIVMQFGPDALDAAGKLDRPRMRERVFADPSALKRLEAIMHPAIRAELARRTAVTPGAYQIHVIPLLVERSRAEAYDRVLVVDCPAEDQLRRLKARDGASEELARQILATQATREQRVSVADDLIVNTGTLEDLRGFVATLHRNYERLAQSRNGAATDE